jgi:NAD(P)-dependent dehydrogenase (short-subunit alcohol dehydrogenase family)
MKTTASAVFLITGASRGLGRATTLAACDAGHRVFATARRPEQLDEVGEHYGSRLATGALDVTDYVAAERAVDDAVSTFGRLDVVVNNAGYADLASVEDMTVDAFRRQVDTNLLGVVNVTKAALPVMRHQGSGHVIQISSLGGRLANPGLSAYQAAKFAVGGFSEALAQEVGPLGIKVTVIEPGGMRTDWGGSSMTIPPVSEPYAETVGTFADLFVSGAAAQATGDPAKVAQVVLLVSQMADPPLRLLLGSDAVAYAGAAAKRRAAEDARWTTLSLSTDYEAGTAT